MSYVMRHTELGVSVEDVIKTVQQYGPKVVEYAEKGIKYLPEAQKALKAAPDALKAVRAVLEDPYLPQVTKRILKLQEIESRRKVVTAKPPAKGPGIGLSAAVKPLDAFIAYRQRPWLLAVVVAALVGIPWYVGYRMGRRRTA